METVKLKVLNAAGHTKIASEAGGQASVDVYKRQVVIITYHPIPHNFKNQPFICKIILKLESRSACAQNQHFYA